MSVSCLPKSEMAAGASLTDFGPSRLRDLPNNLFVYRGIHKEIGVFPYKSLLTLRGSLRFSMG